MFLGSCGGYDNVDKLLNISPHAHMIATQETGSMHVNDPLLYHINESIRKTGKVNWIEEDTYLNGLRSKHKDGYLLPHRNQALLMQKSYKELTQRMQDRATTLTTEGKPNAHQIVLPDNTARVTITQDGKTVLIQPFDVNGRALKDDAVTLKNYDGNLSSLPLYQANENGELVPIKDDKINIDMNASAPKDTENTLTQNFNNAPPAKRALAVNNLVDRPNKKDELRIA
jgi:hypothetical protein